MLFHVEDICMILVRFFRKVSANPMGKRRDFMYVCLYDIAVMFIVDFTFAKWRLN